MGGFREVGHTADVAIEVWGEDLRDLIENAGRGMVSLILDAEGIQPESWEETTVQPLAPSPESLLVACLKEILFAQESGEWLPVAFRVTDVDEDRLQAQCAVGLMRRARLQERVRGAIKAVTYHNLHVTSADGRRTATITFDV